MLFIIDELVKGINIQEVVVRMRRVSRYASKRSHMANASVWVGASGTGLLSSSSLSISTSSG